MKTKLSKNPLEFQWNKKAVFFTITAILIVTIFLLVYGVYYYAQDRTSLNDRIRSMDSSVFSLKQDLQRNIYISGFRILLLFDSKIVETGQSINNLSARVPEAFINGTYKGTTDNDTDFLKGATLDKINGFLAEEAAGENLNFNLTNSNISMIQKDSNTIQVIFTTDINISDKNNLASWNSRENITADINISKFKDNLTIVGDSLVYVPPAG